MPYNVAHLNTTSPFYRLFPDGCPIKNILLPQPAICEGSREDGCAEDVYMVDLDKLSEDKFNELARMVHEQCDPGTSLEVAKKEMKARGLPLRARHVSSVSTDSRFFL